MTELTMQLEEFRKMVQERPHAFDIFESGDLLVTEYHGIVIKAWKTKVEFGTKIYPRSIPITRIGYTGISHQDLDPFKERKKQTKKRVKETKRE